MDESMFKENTTPSNMFELKINKIKPKFIRNNLKFYRPIYHPSKIELENAEPIM